MLGNCSCFYCCQLTWSWCKIKFFKKLFQENYESFKRFGSRSGQAFCWSWSGFRLFAKAISRRQKSLLAKKIFGIMSSDFLSLMLGRVFLGWTSTKEGLISRAQGHTAVTPMSIIPTALRSQIKHSTLSHCAPMSSDIHWIGHWINIDLYALITVYCWSRSDGFW